MTYCLGIAVQEGLVLMSDSRTNAGPDSVSAYSKMRRYGAPGQRQFVICSAGNLATTQAVFNRLENDIRGGAAENLMNVQSVDAAATYVGKLSHEAQVNVPGDGAAFEASFLLGGEVLGEKAELTLIYAQGNHIASSRQTPFLQIGEFKYGKPILDRILSMQTPLEQAALCALVSMEATMRSNVTVAPPIELVLYQRGSLRPGRFGRFGEGSDYLGTLASEWNNLLSGAFGSLPPIDWKEAEST